MCVAFANIPAHIHMCGCIYGCGGLELFKIRALNVFLLFIKVDIRVIGYSAEAALHNPKTHSHKVV